MTFGKFNPLTEKGKKNKANRMAVDKKHTPKDRAKAKAKPIPGYKQRKRK